MVKKQIATIALSVIMMGNVSTAWGSVLDDWGWIGKTNYTVAVVDKITGNCGLPFWQVANGCAWLRVSGDSWTTEKIEVRNIPVLEKGGDKKRAERAYTLRHEICHADTCGLDEKCADECARRMELKYKIAK